jgi:hypothetical protein
MITSQRKTARRGAYGGSPPPWRFAPVPPPHNGGRDLGSLRSRLARCVGRVWRARRTLAQATSYTGLETRRWNGTKSAFADYASVVARRAKPCAGLVRFQAKRFTLPSWEGRFFADSCIVRRKTGEGP